MVRQFADVAYKDDGSHEAVDGPYGDVDWDDDSFVQCISGHDECQWRGTLGEASPPPFTVLLLRPDYIASTFGQDTYLAHVFASDPAEAISLAQTEVGLTDGNESTEDYAVLAVFQGHLDDVKSAIRRG